jgi:hypothetical protein
MAKTGEVITPEIVPGSPADRNRAYRIRVALKKDSDSVPPEDVEWLKAFEAAKVANKGASRSHKVSFTEESAEAVGTGDAAAYAAAMAAPQLAKEEGRRIDNLIAAVIQASNSSNKNIQVAYDMILKMAQQVLERNAQLEQVHLGMLETVRQGHLARTEAEAELIRKEAESAGEDGDMTNGIIAQMMPVVMAEIARRQSLAAGVPLGGKKGK